MAGRIFFPFLRRDIHNVALSSLVKHRFSPLLTFFRGKRRYDKRVRPSDWHVPRKVSGFWAGREMTKESRVFIREQFEEKYRPVVESPLKDAPWQRSEWTADTKRTGVLAVKIGVQPQWTKEGKKFLTTLLQVLDNHVIRYTPPAVYSTGVTYVEHLRGRLNYGSVVVGALSVSPQNFTAAYCGLFTEAGVPPKRKLTRFLVTPDAAIQPGTPLSVTHFRVGDKIDLQAKTIGRGFQGVMKRWGFKGGPKAHGSTKFHRRPGSINCGMKKIYRGKKMAGKMGNQWRTQRSLKIWKIDTKYNVLYVHGTGTPGPTHCICRVMDSSLVAYCEERIRKLPLPSMPTYYPEDSMEPVPEELFDPELFQFTQPTLTYDEKEKAKS